MQDTLLEATLLPEDLALPGTLNVTVFNPPPGGRTSASQMILVSKAPSTSPLAETKDPGGNGVRDDADIDGCDCEIADIMHDHELPAATGGVKS